jgi:RNA polymerase sigma factor (sigma-70 family)
MIMAQASIHSLLRYLRQLGGGSDSATEDATLLKRYLGEGDQSAFTALVQRYGGLVWGACTRMLPHTQDAEDAFQATFLVLARKGGSLRDPDRLGPWLHGVAYRIALKARARTLRRQQQEKALLVDPAAEAVPDLVWQELRAVLDEEVNGLPERYRLPFLLCHFEGLTNEEAARRLGCPRGTILSRLSRARDRLRQRLSRRGVTVSASLLGGVFTQHASASVPAGLVSATVRSSLAFAGGAEPTLSPSISTLAEGGLHAMSVSKLKLTLLSVLALGLVGSGVGLLTSSRATPSDTSRRAVTAPPAKGVGEPGRLARAVGEGDKPGAKAKGKPGDAAKPPPPAKDWSLSLKEKAKFGGIDDPKATLLDALDQMAKIHDLTFYINEKAFKDDELDQAYKTPIAAENPIPPIERPARLSTVLKRILARVPVPSGATYLIRKDAIEITTEKAVRKELGIPAHRPLLPLVWADFKDVTIRNALDQLADASDFNVVVDVRVAKKLETNVTIRLANVPVDTAVQMLADMADQEMVRLDNALYVTSKENAARLRAEKSKESLPRPATPGRPMGVSKGAPKGLPAGTGK